jgi:hypothetical protein
MKQRNGAAQAALLWIVLLHLAINAVHGLAHARANVKLSYASMLFVATVIISCPILGLVLGRMGHRRAGDWLIAGSLAAAFAFGFANHFVISGGDHVSHVTGAWRITFGVTAVLLAATEAVGAAFAVWCATRNEGLRSRAA